MSSSITLNPVLTIRPEKLSDFCLRNHICKLSLFGSALRGELRPESDIDLLVEFEPGREPGLITLAGMELELMEHLGREVQMLTPGDLSRYFREEVMQTAELQYERS
ncbi:MAG: nucleotidyltransferase family protein [Candidatus Omnitrophota bacterium]